MDYSYGTELWRLSFVQLKFCFNYDILLINSCHSFCLSLKWNNMTTDFRRQFAAVFILLQSFHCISPKIIENSIILSLPSLNCNVCVIIEVLHVIILPVPKGVKWLGEKKSKKFLLHFYLPAYGVLICYTLSITSCIKKKSVNNFLEYYFAKGSSNSTTYTHFECGPKVFQNSLIVLVVNWSIDTKSMTLFCNSYLDCLFL